MRRPPGGGLNSHSLALALARTGPSTHPRVSQACAPGTSTCVQCTTHPCCAHTRAGHTHVQGMLICIDTHVHGGPHAGGGGSWQWLGGDEWHSLGMGGGRGGWSLVAGCVQVSRSVGLLTWVTAGLWGAQAPSLQRPPPRYLPPGPSGVYASFHFPCLLCACTVI